MSVYIPPATGKALETRPFRRSKGARPRDLGAGVSLKLRSPDRALLARHVTVQRATRRPISVDGVGLGGQPRLQRQPRLAI